MLLGRRVRVGLVRAALISASKYVSIFSNPVPFLTMSQSEPIPFNCPSCEAEYKIVRIEVCDVQQGKLRCLRCDALLPAGEGRVAFEYFLVGRPSGRNRKRK
jgi:hypothetical protein